MALVGLVVAIFLCHVRAAPGVPPPKPPHTVCVGSVPTADCEAWQDLHDEFNNNGTTAWQPCNGGAPCSREDPCGTCNCLIHEVECGTGNHIISIGFKTQLPLGGTLPESIGNLSMLETLDFGVYGCETVHVTLPATLGKLSNLVAL
jgi:hypothetical protein